MDKFIQPFHIPHLPLLGGATSTCVEAASILKSCYWNICQKYVHQPVLSQAIPSNIVLIINMKNILWCVHEKYSMIFPWQIFYDISMKNILWYVHDKYFMNVCPWKILNNISIKHILWYVHNNFVKSFESAHSIKYSTGVAEPLGKKFHIITCNGAVCQKKGKTLFCSFELRVLFWFFLDSIMFDRNCICGNKSLLPPRETTSSEALQTLGFHPSRSNVLVFCKNISKAFASGPSASQQPENLEWQTIHKYNTLAAWLCDILFFSFLSLFDSLLSHTQKLSQNQVVQISSNKYRLKVLRVCWTQSCDWILLSNLSATRLWLNDVTEDQFSMMHNEICWTTVIICL